MRNCKFCSGEPELYTNPGSLGYYPGVVGYKCSGSCRQHNDGIYYDGDEYMDYDSALLKAIEKWNKDNYKPFMNDLTVEALSVVQMCQYFMKYIDNMSITGLTYQEFLEKLNNKVDIQELFGKIDNSKELEAIERLLGKAYRGET